MKRTSGVLMHISSLWGDYSIGSFGKEAKEFAKFLKDAGFSYWQVLPFCMTDESNSPYKSYSAFGANPLFIDLPTLKAKGFITPMELDAAKQRTPYLCEFERLKEERLPLLRLAAKRAEGKLSGAVSEFLKEYPALSEAAEFMALKSANGGAPWYEFTVTRPDPEELFFWQFVQYEFFTQWQEVKAYANSLGIKIIGDIPIYVAHDSADVYNNPDEFFLDGDGMPSSVAGVPPDYFSEEGQLWGNPLYNWRRMKESCFGWWQRRMEYMLTLFDGVRIDHFRGLEAYFSIPRGAKSAKAGKWVKGPGRRFIDMLKRVAKDKLIIAEDLGDITPAVEALRKYSGFPGMRVLQFAFLGDEKSPHIPHNYEKNSVAYTGTHDNNTLLGYVWEAAPESRKRMLDYCNCAEGEDWSSCCGKIIKTVLSSHADIAIFPIQDILVYGADTRMNTPGTATDNWQYRILESQLSEVPVAKFKYLNSLYGRCDN